MYGPWAPKKAFGAPQIPFRRPTRLDQSEAVRLTTLEILEGYRSCFVPSSSAMICSVCPLLPFARQRKGTNIVMTHLAIRIMDQHQFPENTLLKRTYRLTGQTCSPRFSPRATPPQRRGRSVRPKYVQGNKKEEPNHSDEET